MADFTTLGVELAGSILQYKNVLLTGLAAISHQSGTPASTNVAGTITPTIAGSKIHIMAQFVSGMIVNNDAGVYGTHRIYRSGSSVTDEYIPAETQSNIYFEAKARTSNAQCVFPISLTQPDTPGHSNQTDAITYTVHVAGGSSGTLAVQVNKNGSRTANITMIEVHP
jgi:hypothetical protein